MVNSPKWYRQAACGIWHIYLDFFVHFACCNALHVARVICQIVGGLQQQQQLEQGQLMQLSIKKSSENLFSFAQLCVQNIRGFHGLLNFEQVMAAISCNLPAHAHFLATLSIYFSCLRAVQLQADCQQERLSQRLRFRLSMYVLMLTFACGQRFEKI